MPEPQERLFSGAKRELVDLTSELKGMAIARWDLAWLEIREAGRSIRRLSVPLAVAMALLAAALPVLIVWICEVAANLLGVGRAWPLGLSVLFLIAVGAAIAFAAWRRFRREFAGLEETLEELREDIVWLKEWNRRAEEDAAAETSENTDAANSFKDDVG
jgi:uncharacterized membrane protein YqjE